MTTTSLIEPSLSTAAPSDGTRSDYSDEDLHALAGWLAELPHLDRALTELRRLRDRPESNNRADDAAQPPDCPVCPEPSAELLEVQAQVAHPESVLKRNREISAAVGILMCRHRMTQADAFDRLRRKSQTTHRKLYDIALEVLQAGELPAKGRP